MKRHVVILFVALALVLALGSLALGFPDIPSSHPYAGAIADLSQRGIISGYADGSFGPDNPVVRQQFAKMMVKTLGLPVSQADVCPFPDVPQNIDLKDPLYPDKYVAVCAAQGITVGKDTIPPTFDPYSPITRQQLITMVARAAELATPPDTYVPPFAPAQFYPKEHFDNACRAAYAGLLDGLQGLGVGFDFLADASRGECAQLLFNLLQGTVEPPTPESTTTTTTTIAPPRPETTTTTLPAPVGPLQVHYIDVGQGDSILIVSPEGKVLLIDGGEAGSGALNYLKQNGITHIDLMVATHPHADHIGGLIDVLRAIPVTEVVTNGASTTTRTYERFLDAIAEAQALYREVRRGDRLQLGCLRFDVLNASAQGDLNEESIVLRLLHGEVGFLFAADAGIEAEQRMLGAGGDLRAHVLKVGHHGSRSASSPAFLAAVAPVVAVYSCADGNSFGHPHPEVLANLATVGADIYGTDLNGTVVVTSDGNTYQVTGERGGPRGPPSTTTTTVPEDPGALSLQVVSLTSPVAPGANAALTIKTAPGAHCTITVIYKSGPSQAAGLGPQTADPSGTVTWRWKVGTSTTRGVWSIVVTSEVQGHKETLEIPFEVK